MSDDVPAKPLPNITRQGSNEASSPTGDFDRWVGKVSREVFASYGTTSSSCFRGDRESPTADMEVGTTDTLTTAPSPLASSPTLESLTWVRGSLSAESLPAWEEAALGGREEEDSPQHAVDLDHWGIDAMRRFGYRLHEIIGSFTTASSIHGCDAQNSIAGMRCIIRRATRASDGKEVVIKCVASSTGLSESVKQSIMTEFNILSALRREAVLRVAALFETRFDAWLVFEWVAAGVPPALARGSPAGAVAIALCTQLLHGLAKLRRSSPPAVGPSAGGEASRKERAVYYSGAAASPSDRVRTDLNEDRTPKKGPVRRRLSTGVLTRRRLPALVGDDGERPALSSHPDRVGLWAAAMGSYFAIWVSLPFAVQDAALARVMSSSRDLPAFMTHQGTSATLLNLHLHGLVLSEQARHAVPELLWPNFASG